MSNSEAIKIPEGISEKIASQMAAELAHRLHRTILLEANHGTKRILVINPEQLHHEGIPPSFLADVRAAIDYFKDLRSCKRQACVWAKSIEEKLLSED